MIDKVLKLLQEQVQAHITLLPDRTITEPIACANLMGSDGNFALPPDSVSMTLISLEEERVNKAQSHYPNVSGRPDKMNPELRLNLYLLFSANFNDYLTGIAYLSSIIGFFQGKNLFTPEDTPSMNQGIKRLAVELYSLNFEQQNHLWGFLGAHYMPSVLYKVRMVCIQEEMVRSEGEVVRQIGISNQGGQA